MDGRSEASRAELACRQAHARTGYFDAAGHFRLVAPNGTATTGTPWASAFWMMPMPAWQTTQAARSSTGECATNRSIRTLARALLAGSISAVVMTASR